jgi:hypothetical protein
VGVVVLDALGDGLAVRHLRRADIGLDLELALHAIDDDLEMKLAHALDDGLAALVIHRTRNDGSSCARRCRATPIFSWSAFDFGSTATSMTGSGNSMRSRTIGLLGSHSVSPGRGAFEAGQRERFVGRREPLDVIRGDWHASAACGDTLTVTLHLS